MSAREWGPGDVTMWTAEFRRDEVSAHVAAWDGDGWPRLSDGAYARPLVVIDPENREQVERLRDSFIFATNEGMTTGDAMQHALREFANPTPPTPDEIGLLVEFHADGRQYFVADCHRGQFMEATAENHRLRLAELVVESGKVVKNRNGVQS